MHRLEEDKKAVQPAKNALFSRTCIPDPFLVSLQSVPVQTGIGLTVISHGLSPLSP